MKVYDPIMKNILFRRWVKNLSNDFWVETAKCLQIPLTMLRVDWTYWINIVIAFKIDIRGNIDIPTYFPIYIKGANYGKPNKKS